MLKRDLMILLLAVAGASVDAVIYLLFGVFTANQTGNVIVLAVALAQGHLTPELHAAISFVGFISGVGLGELIVVENRDSVPWPSAVGRALVVELVPLVGFVVGWRLAGPSRVEGTTLLLIALDALAMGIQSSAVLRLGAGVATTYVTGMLTTFLTEAIEWLKVVEMAPAISAPRPNVSARSSRPDRGPGSSGSPGSPTSWARLLAGCSSSGSESWHSSCRWRQFSPWSWPKHDVGERAVTTRERTGPCKRSE
jgi:uncharacterized membrane protein YoaK (UPF0700 family)